MLTKILESRKKIMLKLPIILLVVLIFLCV